MLQLNNIHVKFTQNQVQNHVLKGINLHIQKGEFVTVIGGNGAGKSTLMNVVAGHIIPTEGEVWIDGSNITKLPEHIRSNQVARVFQDPGTFSDLTIEENLSIAHSRGKKRGFSSAITTDLREKFREAVAILNMNLENRLNTKVSSLSGGQRQALSLIMATFQDAKILLLDEHTSALDPKTVLMILQITREIIAQHSLTALMITHSVHDALEVGNRVLMMYRGEILHDIPSDKKASLSAQDLLHLFD